jgi:hypothetical protein
VVAAGTLAFQLRFGPALTPYSRGYLLLSLLFAPVLVAAFGLARAYESRFLFVGTDEYQRVIRAGIALTAFAAAVSYAFEIQLARSYVLIALPAATFATHAACGAPAAGGRRPVREGGRRSALRRAAAPGAVPGAARGGGLHPARLTRPGTLPTGGAPAATAGSS